MCFENNIICIRNVFSKVNKMQFVETYESVIVYNYYNICSTYILYYTIKLIIVISL